jgi:hypothetical protein
MPIAVSKQEKHQVIIIYELPAIVSKAQFFINGIKSISCLSARSAINCTIV